MTILFFSADLLIKHDKAENNQSMDQGILAEGEGYVQFTSLFVSGHFYIENIVLPSLQNKLL
jgi:hypothetical protein